MKLEKKLAKNPGFKKLCKAFAGLNDQKQVEALLRDVCTINELDEMGRRMEAAELLKKNIPYRSISEKTGLSTTTVTRIAHWIHHGMGGYDLVLG
ncbi:DNA-binding transcriptional regulator [Patescibacteria group bacterium]|nr:DNA-binding transcriptional regulator [Patescibacteria group bacterium]MBU1683801.1 DNA-binding transcriptional regulator [Patescibacteria group bacterium]MBU1934515.1 DNA-binding transcriptional regulator [Patescibacteria group bacterium]